MSNRYTVQQGLFEGETIYLLRDEETRTEAKILPSIGANCIAYSREFSGRRFDILEPPPDPRSLSDHPSGFGYPILFPFPNRVRGGRFEFEGKTFQMDVPEPGGNTIHGFVNNRPWRVLESVDSGGASLSLSFDSADHPDVQRQFPFPFRAELTIGIEGGVLTHTFKGENVGPSRMPVGYGIHPYFLAPLLPGGDPALCTVRVPVRKLWELDDLLPTGRLLPAVGELDLLAGKSMAGATFDAVFTDVVNDPDGLLRSTLTDRGAGVELVVESNGPFFQVVVYTPPGRASICFEPYTCTTDAFNLQSKGVDAGLIVLEPGASLSCTIRVITKGVKTT